MTDNPARQWAKPFNLHITDPTGDYVLHGAQFPSGHCMTNSDERGFVHLAVSVEALLEMFAGTVDSARIIWPTAEESDRD